MPIVDLFSKRQRRARGEVLDVYAYDKLPETLRVQIVHIIRDSFGEDRHASDFARDAYKYVKQALCREYGRFELIEHAMSDAQSVFDFLLQVQSTEQALDVVEISFWVIDAYIRDNAEYQTNTQPQIRPDEAISELNERFREHGIGYQFESGKVIRVDSEYLHSEAIRPALVVLRGKGFKGANEEFLSAHEHYRHGRYKECLVDCLKAFESTMKAICTIRGWHYEPNDTAKDLIDTCFQHGLVPAYLQSQFASLRSLLESGTPVLRNKTSAHGQGPDLLEVPGYFARYALNLTATSILFLVEASAATK